MQYPDTIRVTVKAASTRDAQGNYTQPASTTTELKGRWEVSERGFNDGYITAVDGKRVQYTGIVYLPKGTAHPPIGAQVDVWETIDGNLRKIAQGEVKQFCAGLFNCKLWL